MDFLVEMLQEKVLRARRALALAVRLAARLVALKAETTASGVATAPAAKAARTARFRLGMTRSAKATALLFRKHSAMVPLSGSRSTNR